MFFLIIYLVGYILSYLLLRKAGKRGGDYTIGLRTLALFMSLFSWYMVIIVASVEFEEWYKKIADRKAKW